MFIKIVFPVTLLLLLISHPVVLLATQKGVPADSPFNIMADRLPANYTGNEIDALYAKLVKTVPTKDEFETTAQYAARLNATIKEEIYAFKIQADNVVYISYDADGEIMTVKITAHENNNEGLIIAPGDEPQQHIASLSVRGITVRGNALERNKYSVAVPNIPHSIDDPTAPELKITIPIKPDAARQIKPNLAALLICKLKRVSASESLTFWVPEKTPDGRLNLHKYINVELEAIWIYDTSTGQILKKEQMKK